MREMTKYTVNICSSTERFIVFHHSFSDLLFCCPVTTRINLVYSHSRDLFSDKHSPSTCSADQLVNIVDHLAAEELSQCFPQEEVEAKHRAKTQGTLDLDSSSGYKQ